MLCYTLIMMALFTNFYIKTYLQNGKVKEHGKKES